jgi:uncharacterized protein (DUF58 family)
MSEGAFSNPLRGRNQALAIFAVAAGSIMVASYFLLRPLYESPNPLTMVIYLGVGGLLVLLGLRLIMGGVVAHASRLGAGNVLRWYRASMPVPALCYLGILFILLVGSMVGRGSQSASNMLLLAFGMMAGPFVVNGTITFSMLRNAVAQRTLPRHAVAGEPFTVDLRLDNFSRFFSSWMMTVRDSIRGPGGQWTGASLFTRVGRRSSRESMYQLVLGRRGKYRFGPLQVMSRFPMGLVERAVVLEDYADLVVFPRIGRVLQTSSDQRAQQADLVHQPQSRRGAHDDEYHALREFRAGDPTRAIHWKTSARRAELMVREFEQQRRADLTIFLDATLPPTVNSLDRQKLELAFSVAATLLADQMRHASDSTLTLVLISGQPQARSGLAMGATLDELMTLLALAEPVPLRTAAEPMSPEQLAAISDGWQMSPRAARSLVLTLRSGDAATSLLGQISASGMSRPIECIDLSPERLARWIEFPQGPG